MSNASYRMVYQLRLTVDPKERVGCIFGTQEDEFDQDQSFVCDVPPGSDTDDWRNYSYRFPGLKDDQYVEFEAKHQDDTLVVDTAGIHITFSSSSMLSHGFAPPFWYSNRNPSPM